MHAHPRNVIMDTMVENRWWERDAVELADLAPLAAQVRDLCATHQWAEAVGPARALAERIEQSSQRYFAFRAEAERSGQQVMPYDWENAYAILLHPAAPASRGLAQVVVELAEGTPPVPGPRLPVDGRPLAAAFESDRVARLLGCWADHGIEFATRRYDLPV